MVATILEASQVGITSTANTDEYWYLVGGNNKRSGEASAGLKLRSAGNFKNLLVKLSANSVAATSTFTLRKNATTDGTNVLSVGSTATGDFEDATPHNDASAAADIWCLKTHPGAASGTYTIRIVSILFEATTNTVSLFANSGTPTYSTASTSFFLPLTSNRAGTNPTTTEANCKVRMRKAGTFKYLGVKVATNRAQATTVTLHKNGSGVGINNSISVTGGGATGWYEDTTHSDTVTAGEDWNYVITTGTGTDNFVIDSIKVEWESTNGDGVLAICEPDSGLTVNDASNTFFPIGGVLNSNATETGAATGIQTKARAAFDVSEATCLVTANDVSSASSLMFRKGGADTALVASITGSTTGVFSDSTHTVTLVSTDQINLQLVVPSVSGAHAVTIRNATISTHLSNNYTTSIATETVSVSESLTRLLAATRNPVETTSISETPARMLAANRALPTETTTISESLVKSKGQPSRLSTETVTVGETLARMLAATRNPQETTSSSESLTRMLAATRALVTETTTISESLVKSKGNTRNPVESVTISEGLTRMLAANRPLATETTTVGETLARQLAASRALIENTAVSDSLARLITFVRTLATETVTIGESLTRMLAANRPLATETVTVSGGTLNRQLAATRALTTETVAISESITRMLAASRTLSDTTSVGENLTRQLAASRALATEITNVSDQLTRMLAATRALQDTIIISEQLDTQFTSGGGGAVNYNRSLTETTAISESLTRMLDATRALAAENTAISDSLQRSIGNNRTLSENVSIGESLLRKLDAFRTNIENTSVVDSISRMLSATRTNIENTSVSDSLTKQLGAIRSIIENTISSDNIQRQLTAFRTLIENTSISDILDYVYGAVGAVHYVVNLVENVSVSDSVKTWIEYIKIITGSTRGKIDAEGRPEHRQTAGWFRNSFYTLTRKRRKGLGEGIG